MAKPTVWVIEAGEYSDYRVLGVFSTRDHAQRIADILNGPDGDSSYPATVSEWPLDPAIDDLDKHHVPFHLLMLRDGALEKCERQEVTAHELAGTVAIWRRSQASAFKGKGVPDVLDATVWAKDEGHAIKIANEHRARLIATGEWESAT